MKCSGPRFVDLFSGLGGFHVALKASGARCVFASEIDPRLQDLYECNFGIRPAGDLTQIRPESVPRHDILCAGFPCQPFSKAGEQDGFRDRTRGTVLFNVLEILRAKRPQFAILENVPNFRWHREGRTYDKVFSQLRSLGYCVESRELSPHQFGVPQIRSRLYIVAKLGSLDGFRWPAPDGRSKTPDLRSILDIRPEGAKPLNQAFIGLIDIWQDFLRRLPDSVKLPWFPIWSMEFGASYPFEDGSLHDISLTRLRKSRGSFGQPLIGRSRHEIIQRVPPYAAREGDAFPRWKQKFIRLNRQFFLEHRSHLRAWLPIVRPLPASYQKFEWNCQGGDRDIWKYVLQFRASGLRVRRPTMTSSLVSMTATQVPIIAWERRFMTVRECARLQSLDTLRFLPDGIPGFKALGNAVNAEVVRRIANRLLERRSDSYGSARAATSSGARGSQNAFQ